MKYRNLILVIWALLVLAGCAAKIEKPVSPLVLVAPTECPSFTDDLDKKLLESAIDKSMEYYQRLPETRLYHFGNNDYTVKELKESLLEFLKIMGSSDSERNINNKIRDTFDVYKSVGSNGKGRVLFTGYYAPVLRGSLTETPEYRYPIYRIPHDHIIINLGKFKNQYKGKRIIARLENGEVVPYYTREDIDTKGCLKGKGLEIAWFADPVDLFFLHIQGSGIISLPDGSVVCVSYAQCNGHSYKSVGRLLVDEKKLSMEGVSLKSIKKYVNEHPEEMSNILNHNESYVFFRIVEEGPVGSLNVPVTAGRTIATDPTQFPKGAIAFIRTRKPVIDKYGNIISWIPFSRFVLNQDTGGAIIGPGRVDLFCGTGRHAGITAGHTKEEGELYFLVKKK
jgi:membrane-bound lytic murein transglycosylase A